MKIEVEGNWLFDEPIDLLDLKPWVRDKIRDAVIRHERANGGRLKLTALSVEPYKPFKDTAVTRLTITAERESEA